MELDDRYEQTSTWPIELEIDGKRGLTLWCETEYHEYVLAQGEYVLLFTSPSSLRQFIAQDRTSNLMALPGYLLFQTFSRRDPDLTAEPESTFEATSLLENFEEDWHQWEMPQVVDVLNMLNMLWDVAESVKHEAALELVGLNSELRRFADDVLGWDIGGPEQLDREFSRADIRSRVSRAVELLSPHVIVVA